MENLCGSALLAKAVGPIATIAATGYNTGTGQRPVKEQKAVPPQY